MFTSQTNLLLICSENEKQKYNEAGYVYFFYLQFDYENEIRLLHCTCRSTPVQNIRVCLLVCNLCCVTSTLTQLVIRLLVGLFVIFHVPSPRRRNWLLALLCFKFTPLSVL